jgi:hypothetical protein
MDLEILCSRLTDAGAYLTTDGEAIGIPLFVDTPQDDGSTSCYALCEPLPEQPASQHMHLPGRRAVVIAFVRTCDVEDRIIQREVHTVTTSPKVAEAAMRRLVVAHTASGVRDAGDPQIRNEEARRRLLADYLEALAREISWRSMLTLPGRLRAAARTLERRAAHWEPACCSRPAPVTEQPTDVAGRGCHDHPSALLKPDLPRSSRETA